MYSVVFFYITVSTFILAAKVWILFLLNLFKTITKYKTSFCALRDAIKSCTYVCISVAAISFCNYVSCIMQALCFDYSTESMSIFLFLFICTRKQKQKSVSSSFLLKVFDPKNWKYFHFLFVILLIPYLTLSFSRKSKVFYSTQKVITQVVGGASC